MKIFITSLLLALVVLGNVSAQDNPSPYEIGLQLIEEARVSNSSILDLTDLALTQLPPELFSLTQVRELRLSRNQLTSLPPEIDNLSLIHLNLNDNQLSSLPPEIGNLSDLKNLQLKRNMLFSLPPEIGNLSNLENLWLTDNNLTALPPEIGNLLSLKQLYLDANNLSSLPPEMGRLENLCRLSIRDNEILELPIELGQVHSLTRRCSIMNIETGLYLDGNPVSIPEEVLDGGTSAILAYLRNEAWWHFQRLVIGALLPVGIIAVFMLSLRLRGEKAKRKRGNT